MKLDFFLYVLEDTTLASRRKITINVVIEVDTLLPLVKGEWQMRFVSASDDSFPDKCCAGPELLAAFFLWFQPGDVPQAQSKKIRSSLGQIC
jgi:hypothetical protein